MIGGIRELPEKQRAALVLAEVHGMSHADIGSVLGVRPEQVKAYVFQARSNLLSDRHAREADCREIREELATATGSCGRARGCVVTCAPATAAAPTPTASSTSTASSPRCCRSCRR